MRLTLAQGSFLFRCQFGATGTLYVPSGISYTGIQVCYLLVSMFCLVRVPSPPVLKPVVQTCALRQVSLRGFVFIDCLLASNKDHVNSVELPDFVFTLALK